MITVGSLFSGIGGFDLGLERAGFKIKWQVEINEWCQKILTKHWPNVSKYRDIRRVGIHNLEAVNLICGGFPCQPFSTAGKRKGKEDDRYLWPEMLRVISELQPRWVIGENVAGFVSMGLDDCISDLESQGYEVQTFIIPACALNAPHRRDRVWIVAYSKSSDDRRRTRKIQSANELQTEKQQKEWFPEFSGSSQIPHTSQDPKHNGCNDGKYEEQECVRFKRDISARNKVGVYKKKNVANAESLYAQRFDNGQGKIEFRGSGWWDIEPGMGRVASGIPDRVDRLKGLGNAVVPQIPELIGRMILQIEESLLLLNHQ